MDALTEQMFKVIGRPPKFESAEDFKTKSKEYFDWCDANPIEVYTRTTSDDKIVQQTKRPYTLQGLMLWLGITNWTRFKQYDYTQTEDFVRVIRACEETIKRQQIEGAMSGAYNSNLVARLNGISEKQETTTKTEVTLTKTQFDKLPDNLLYQIIDALDEKENES